MEDFIVDKRKSSLDDRQSLVKKNGFKIIVDDEILYKENQETGKMERYFLIIIQDIEKSEISRVEKTYEDFKGFEKSMGYQLRNFNISVPKLERRESAFNFVMGSNNDLFKYV